MFNFLKPVLDGGWIMLSLWLLSGIVFSALFQRFLFFFKKAPELFVEASQLAKSYQFNLESKFDEFILNNSIHANRYEVLIKVCVIIAPLLGLLGTVSGMIQTFDSLGSGSLDAQGGGIAGGISQALLTTQAGLVVAIPGILIGRYLNKKAQEFQNTLMALKEKNLVLQSQKSQ